jgi:hypothetical protein
MGEEDCLCALPLFLRRGHFLGLQLPLVKEWNGVDDNPRDATSKIDDLRRQDDDKQTAD